MSSDAAESIASSGVDGLDQILRGGYRRDQLYLIEGDTGAGKTTIAIQFLLEGARRAERCLYLGFSERPEDLEHMARAHGWSLEGVGLENVAVAAEGDDREQYTLFPASEVELRELTREIARRVDSERPQRLVIDPVSALRWYAGDPAEYRRYIEGLGQTVRQYRCTALLIDDVNAAPAQFHPRGLVNGVIVLSRRGEEYGPDRRQLRVEKLRGVPVTGGLHDYRIATGGVLVYPRIGTAPRPETSLERPALLDDGSPFGRLLGGGIPAGRSVLISGPAGTGKSTIALSWAATALRRGDAVLYLSFDEAVENITARGAALGMELGPHLDSGMLRLEKIDPASRSPGEVAHEIQHAADEYDGRLALVVIDSLSGYMHATGSTRYLDLQLHQLLHYLAQRSIIGVMVLTQQGVFGETQPPVDVSYLSDVIVLTRFFEEDGALHRGVSVIKHRSQRHENTVRELLFTQEELSLGEPLTGFQGLLSEAPPDRRS